MKPLVVGSPCGEDWNAMRRDGAGRHCASCDTRVYDFQAMTESEIRGIAILHGGHFCGRQVIRDGETLVRPEPAAPRRTPFALRVASRGAFVAGALALAACDPSPSAHAAPTPIVHVPSEPAPRGPTHGDPKPAPTPTPAPPPDAVRELKGDIAWEPPPVDRDVLFARGKATLGSSRVRALDDIAAALAGDPSIQAIGIVGHVGDDEVSRPSDLALAMARAEAARAYLVAKGVAAARIRIAAAPRVDPVGAKASPDERARTRRVEIRACTDLEHCPDGL
ncbi:MAG: OmpA family protein [Myxococcota bacterium]